MNPVDLFLGLLKLSVMGFLGGLIAFLGDNVGRWLGKRRVRILGIRPRYTSMIFTVIFGVIISLVSIGLMAIFSSDVRTYLFHMSELRKSLEELKREQAELMKEIDTLKMIINSGQLLYPMNAPLLVLSLRDPKELKNVERAVKKIVRDRVILLSKLLDQPLPEDYLRNPVEFDEKDMKKLREALQRGRKVVIIVYAKKNTFLGERVLLGIRAVNDKLVFRKGQVILRIKVDGKQRIDEILSQLLSGISLVREAAIKRGKLPLPQLGGGIGGNVDPVKLLKAADEIKRYGGEVEVVFKAPKDIYTADEFSIDIEVKPLEKGGGESNNELKGRGNEDGSGGIGSSK